MNENQERTYVDIISELYKNIESDIIPQEEKTIILNHLDIVAERLWKYSG